MNGWLFHMNGVWRRWHAPTTAMTSSSDGTLCVVWHHHHSLADDIMRRISDDHRIFAFLTSQLIFTSAEEECFFSSWKRPNGKWFSMSVVQEVMKRVDRRRWREQRKRIIIEFTIQPTIYKCKTWQLTAGNCPKYNISRWGPRMVKWTVSFHGRMLVGSIQHTHQPHGNAETAAKKTQ